MSHIIFSKVYISWNLEHDLAYKEQVDLEQVDTRKNFKRSKYVHGLIWSSFYNTINIFTHVT